MTAGSDFETDQHDLDYDPAVCDLCKSEEFTLVLEIPGTSMTSDSRVVQSGLRKLQCSKCGLVRDGYLFTDDRLHEHYGSDYRLGEQAAAAEPLFYASEGPIRRSRAIFEWMHDNLRDTGFTSPRSALEIGCGEGSLLSEFADHWKGGSVSGVDMSARSVDIALSKGLYVSEGSYKRAMGSYDLIYSFAVIEHLPSPSDFLIHVKRHLAPGGLVLTAQPCQDHGSSDIFFSDHLYHFFSKHVASFGRRAGLREIKRADDNPLLRGFSLHVFEVDPQHVPDAPMPTEADTFDIGQGIAEWKAIFEGVDGWLRSQEDRRLAVWGVGQTFTLLSAYTRLKDRTVEVAIDDNPDRFNGNPNPPVRLDEIPRDLDSKIALLLTFQPNQDVLDRLKQRGVVYYAPLSEPSLRSTAAPA